VGKRSGIEQKKAEILRTSRLNISRRKKKGVQNSEKEKRMLGKTRTQSIESKTRPLPSGQEKICKKKSGRQEGCTSRGGLGAGLVRIINRKRGDHHLDGKEN